jgi:enoyl-CoA hydratase/carnithine racemase
VRIAADDAVIGLPAAREAFIPGMATWRLPRLLGMGHARHLLFSGEEIGPDEAYRIGLVNRLVPRGDMEKELADWADRYRQVPASSLKWVKRLTNQAFDLPFAGFLEEMDRAMEAALVSGEHLAARRAWRDRIRRRRGGKQD